MAQSVANVRSIRAMALDQTFGTKFLTELDAALVSGNKAAFGTGAGSGTATVLPYFIQGKLYACRACRLPANGMSHSFDAVPHGIVPDERVLHDHRDVSGLLADSIQCDFCLANA